MVDDTAAIPLRLPLLHLLPSRHAVPTPSSASSWRSLTANWSRRGKPKSPLELANLMPLTAFLVQCLLRFLYLLPQNPPISYVSTYSSFYRIRVFGLWAVEAAMKGRSHRLPTAEPDDWVDGSWTVDCTCGVTFDDGEEMVSCDECGVWVHTRCSRFVKGETSFTCDKCKSKCSRKESEETEVAQLLVEMPTQTIRMDSFAARRPFRLWTDIPIAERVHVQGVPGGDPALFEGLSVFTSQLWKCTGYVPKTFNFRFREFPSWEEKPGGEPMPSFGSLIGGEVGMQHDEKIEKDDENPVNIGADVLFNLSKKVSVDPENYVSSRLPTPDDWNQEPPSSPKGVKKRDGKALSSKLMPSLGKSEKTQFGMQDLHTSKRKREEGFKDQTLKKKSKGGHKEGGGKNKIGSQERIHQFRGDAPKMGLEGDFSVALAGVTKEVLKLVEKNKSVKSGSGFDDCNDDEQKHNKPKPKIDFSNDDTEQIFLQKQECFEDEKSLGLFKAGAGNINSPTKLSTEKKVSIAVPVKVEETNVVNSPNLSTRKVKVETEDDSGTNKTTTSSPTVSNKDSAVECKLNSEMPDKANDALIQNSLSSFAVRPPAKQLVQETGTSDKATGKPHENLEEHETISSTSLKERTTVIDREEEETHTRESGKLAQSGVRGSSEAEPSCRDSEELGDSSSKSRHGMAGSFSSQNGTLRSKNELGRSTTLYDGSSKSRHGTKFVAGSPKSSNTNSGSLPFSRHKLASGHGRLPTPGVSAKSVPNAIDLGSSSTATGNKQLGTSGSMSMGKPHSAKHREKSNLSIENKNIDLSFGSFGGESSQEMSASKDRIKIPVTSGSKMPHSRPIVSASSKHGTLSKQKEQVPPPSSRASPSHSAPTSSGTGNAPVALQDASAIKQMASDACSKGDKHDECPQPSMKVTSALPLTHAPVPVATAAPLSDEELALLLHQELNSSPRVPRISRMRHAGSIPQGTSQTTFSTLVKRSSVGASPASAGVKDHNLASRRKIKDDSSRENSRTVLDDTKKSNRKSPAQRSQEESKADDSAKKDVDGKSSEDFGSAKKVTSLTTSTVGNNCHSSSAEASDPIVTSRRHPATELSDDDGTPLAGASTRLIDEILSKNKEMSYEELCAAVLPHWHNLRKHNGERYAYSSHSHAVLDCLRNRNAWAQLVDRGPKTNLSRKKRKLEPDTADTEPESRDGNPNTSKLKNEEGGGGTSDPHEEDVAKGKRRSRSYRRLALQGRRLKRKKGKRRPKAVVTDDDYDALSASSGGADSNYSDEESEGARADTLKNKLSSDESESEQGEATTLGVHVNKSIANHQIGLQSISYNAAVELLSLIYGSKSGARTDAYSKGEVVWLNVAGVHSVHEFQALFW
ncbi:PHD finger protein [Nymphaea thermarum]|nr:PHD finger protein [Nymphaea thermarum]